MRRRRSGVPGFPAPAVRLRARRRALMLTVTECAKACGVDPVTIKNIENGRTHPSLGTLMLICRGLQVDLGWLFGVKWSTPPIAPDVASGFALLQLLTRSERAQVLTMMRTAIAERGRKRAPARREAMHV